MKNLKSTFYPVAIVAFLMGLVGIGLVSTQFTISIEPQSSDIQSPPAIEPSIAQPEQPPPIRATPSPILPTPTTSVSERPDDKAIAVGEGAFRVSNPTEHPIRLALLERQSSSKSYGKPAHWDFAPMEGGTQGLILSLPQEPLKLKKGDILVAFAQDGSRLYWGPYVVGETPIPTWNPQKAEWQLVLELLP
ncbi:MAG TPA: hypothetical protein V6C91_06265 [Coleofasciculaceae cyanobacterium]